MVEGFEEGVSTEIICEEARRSSCSSYLEDPDKFKYSVVALRKPAG